MRPAAARRTMSLGPPGGYGTTMRTGRCGHACAHASSGAARVAAAARTKAASRSMVRTALSSSELEQPLRVFLQDERLHLGAKARSLEVLQPAVRHDQREVGAEQDAVL